MDWKLFFGYMGYVVVLVSCMSGSPGETKNSIQIGTYVFDMTLGPFTTIVTLPFLLWGFQVIVKRQLDKRDKEREKKEAEIAEAKLKKELEFEEQKKEALRLKAALDKGWRDNLENLILENRQHVTQMVESNKEHIVGKLEQVCDTLKERQQEFRVHNHIVDPDKKRTTALITTAEGI